MPRFSEFYYNTANYGIKAPLQYSADPMSAIAVFYDGVNLSFASPGGTFVEFRVVRNQENYPQSQEDGVIVYSWSTNSGDLTNEIDDGRYFDKGTVDTFSELPLGNLYDLYLVQDTKQKYIWNGSGWVTFAPLVPGKFVYYRAWIRAATAVDAEATADWVKAGTTFTLLPAINTLSIGRDTVFTAGEVPTRDRSIFSQLNDDVQISTTHSRFMSIIPSVFTSSTNSMLDVPTSTFTTADRGGLNNNSLISTFMSAFSYTVDELVTWIKGIHPDNQGHTAGAAVLQFRSHELGMTQDYEDVTITQKKLLGNAVNVYRSKGTSYGLETYVKSITGYAAEVEVTRNLLLSHQNSTFDVIGWTTGSSIGDWSVVSGSPVLAVVTDQTVPSQADAIDTVYSLKITPDTTGNIIGLGSQSPITHGIPVTADSIYSLSFYAKNSASANVTAEIRWYDRGGVLLSSSTGTSTATGTSFTRISLENKTAPTGAVYASIKITFEAGSAYYIDMVQFENSDSVTDYQEPRGAVITLSPTKTNLILNPSFETNTTGWTGTNCSLSRDTSTAYFGKSACSVVASSAAVITVTTSAYITVTPGKHYSASGYLKDGNTGKTFVAGIKYYDVDNVQVGSTTGIPVTLSTSSYTRAEVNFLAPRAVLDEEGNVETKEAVKAKVYFASTSAVADTQSVLIDSVQFEQSETPTDYFDGSLSSRGCGWGGTEDNSASHYYLALSNRVTRLQEEVTDYIGLDTPYYIKFSGTPTISGSLSGIA